MNLVINLLAFVLLITGIILVTRNLMIYNIRKLAIYCKLNTKVVGQLLGYATSMPELIGAIVAGSVGMIDTSISNVMSSNVVNIIFLLIVTLIFKRFRSIINKKFIQDYLFLVISLLAPIYLILSSNTSNPLSILMFVFIYILFLVSAKYTKYFEDEIIDLKNEEKREQRAMSKIPKRKLSFEKKHKIIKCILLLILSVVLLYVLGSFMGNILENLGERFKISGYVLGIIMGVATSIPELMTYISAYKKHRKFETPAQDKGAVEAVNDMVTSNISNLCIIQTVAILCFMLFAK